MDFFIYPGRNTAALMGEPTIPLACGIAAWTATAAALHPLEVLQIRLQQEAMYAPSKSSLQVLRATLREGLFRGLTFNIAAAAAQRLYVPIIYEKTKAYGCQSMELNRGMFGQNVNINLFEGLKEKKYMLIGKCSLLSGLVTALFDVPKDALLCRRLAQERTAALDPSFIPRKSIRSIVSNSSSLSPSNFVGTCFVPAAVKWTVFFAVFEFVFSTQPLYPSAVGIHSHSIADVMLASSVAGVASVLVSYPVETAKQAIQSHPYEWYEKPVATGPSALYNLMSKHGTQCYRGITVAMARHAVMWPASFYLYDQLRSPLLRVAPGSAYHF